MGLYSAPPPSRNFRDDKPTLLVCWWCTSFAAAIILFRVAGRYIRSERLFKEDWLSLACLIPLFIRMSFVHLVLVYGTNNMLTDGVSADVLSGRITGSQLVLGARVFYAATLWLLKFTITEFFKRLTPLHLWKPSYEWAFQVVRWILVVTFFATIIADLVECQPVTHYWQVTPDPGPQCRQGYAQLITLGACNVLTDLLLVLFPVPVIIGSHRSVKRKLQLTMLFALSLFPVVSTAIRIPNIIERQGSQQYRSLWASAEILVATAVANALVLGSFVRDRGVKKLKFKYGSTSDSIERTSSRRGTVQRHWGSDEDLVRGLGIGVEPELRRGSNETLKPRVAPKAIGNTGHPARINQDWRFPDTESEESDIVKFMNGPPHSPNDVSFINTPRKVSFFDVGGLLENDGSNSSWRAPSMAVEDVTSISRTMSHDSQSPLASKKGSKALLQDLGGLLNSTPSSRAPKSFKQVSVELQSIPSHRDRPEVTQKRPSPQLNDVGGLLK